MVIETYKAMAEIETLTGQSLGMHQTGCVCLPFHPIIKMEFASWQKHLHRSAFRYSSRCARMPDLDGFIAATGCACAGIAMSGGIGRFISELVVGLAPFIDSAPHRIDRFSAVDLMNCEFIQSCADARAGKVTG
ncbi:MAG: FAD-binding oxidoreductase [Anaerolineales bacterium]|nr:FAD-binding oxidoreductase [Anaerolineales bacterium]